MKYRYGIITDFTVDKTKETITVYFSFYRRNKKEQKRFCRVSGYHAHKTFSNLPIYKPDGMPDLSYLEGMRVKVMAVGCFNRIFIKELADDLNYYLNKDKSSNHNG